MQKNMLPKETESIADSDTLEEDILTEERNRAVHRTGRR
mgnify:CR=1 FL=1